MTQFFIRRLQQLIFTLFFVSIVVFGMIHIIPGDPAATILGEEATEKEYKALREKLGLNKPILQQYVEWISRVARGDLGISLATNVNVATTIRQRMPATLLLAFSSMIVGTLIALPTGIISALKKNTPLDYLASFFGLIGLSFPRFWVGILMIMLFSLYFGLLPPGGYVSPFTNPSEGLRRLFLPAFTLGIALAAHLMRMTRSCVLEELSKDYVKTAKSKGLHPNNVICKHVLKNAIIPVITVLGLQIGLLIGGAVIVEQVFYWPGIGREIVTAVHDRDYPLIQGCVLMLALGYILINVIIDILYVIINPRVRI